MTAAGKIRVLIVDDSSVVRRALADAISADPGLEVAGTASNGAIALERIAQLEPSVVTMDVEMPEMSGLEALAAIRRIDRGLPVIMVSSLTERGAAITLEALALGATDYVTKPSAGGGGGGGDRLQFVRDLLPKLKYFGAARAQRSTAPAAAPPPVAPARPAVPPQGRVAAGRIEIVAIGVSTGGPNALAELIPALPADFPVPIVVVQHMPPLFTKLLAERLAGKAALRVKEGEAGDPVSAGDLFIAPGNHHMVIERTPRGNAIALHQEAPENSCRPAVDVLFRSVSELYGAGVLAVVLTGMGQDGWRGCESVREHGGQVLVQDEESSVVWGMPGFVADAGLADEILPLDRLAAAIVRRAQVGRRGPAFGAGVQAGAASSPSSFGRRG
jgi:two-component system chemotaxis response regulator CheB